MLANRVATPEMIAVAAEMFGKFSRSYISFILRVSHRATAAQAADAMRSVALSPAARGLDE